MPDVPRVSLLRQYSAHRSLFFEAIKLPPVIIKASRGILLHLLFPLCALVIIVSIFQQAQRLSLFSLHPTCMTIGVVVFVSEGIVTYRNSSVSEAFAPIMESPKKMKSKSFHRAMQYIGVFFLSVGMISILGHKFTIGKTFWPSTMHSLVAVFSIVAILVQVVVGVQKIASTARIQRWHGSAGLLAWDLLVLTMLLGMIQYYSISLLNVCAATALCLVWAAVHLQFKGENKGHQVHDDDGDGLLIAEGESNL